MVETYDTIPKHDLEYIFCLQREGSSYDPKIAKIYLERYKGVYYGDLFFKPRLMHRPYL